MSSHLRLRPRAAPTIAALLAAMLVSGPLAAAPGSWSPLRPPVPAVLAADPTPEPTGGDPGWHVGPAGDVRIDLWFGFSSTCPHCAAAKPWLAEAEAAVGWLDVHALQVDGEGPEIEVNRTRLIELAASVGAEISGVPAFLFGGRLRTGFLSADTTGAELRAEIEAYHAQVLALVGPVTRASPGPSPGSSASPGPEVPVDLPFMGQVDAATVSPALLAVILGGLDAFNPCALSVLLFLLSLLVGTRSRTRMALVGGIFVAVSGLVYFLLMAAWLNVFLLFGELRIVTLVAGALAVAAAGLNIKDFVAFRRGVSLVMPDAAKPQVFGRMFAIVDAATLPALLGTTILVAAVANTYEMLCTGGFPVVYTRVLTLDELPTLAYYGYLALYNLVYVSPMLAIVAVFTLTLGSHTVTRTEARRLKLLSGLLMLGLGLLLLLAPERLADMGATLSVFGLAVLVSAVLVGLDVARGQRGRTPA
jgi:cytochrome c biogenesis protein CcdA